MNNIVGIIGSGSDGGTFLDWSLYYLSNQKYIYSTTMGNLQREEDAIYNFKKMSLVENPLMTSKNKITYVAHRHFKTHPTQFSIDSCIEKYKQLNDDDLSMLSFYCVQINANNWMPLEKFALKYTNLYPEIKFIVIHADNETYMDLYNRAISINFGINDKNELLNYVKKSITEIKNTNNRYMLNVRDIYNNLDQLIPEIFEWANRKISTERYDNWKSIYNHWKDTLPKNTSK